MKVSGKYDRQQKLTLFLSKQAQMKHVLCTQEVIMRNL